MGEMLVYQSYNIKSPLNGEAAKWAAEHADELPLQTIDLSIELTRRAQKPLAMPEGHVDHTTPPRPATRPLGMPRPAAAAPPPPKGADETPKEVLKRAVAKAIENDLAGAIV